MSLENDRKPEYLMIIDILPSSKLDITKYLERHGVIVSPDIHKENKFRVKCEHDVFCSIFNEIVMMKDFARDTNMNVDYRLGKTLSKLFIFENSHIANLIYCKLSNKKLYKHYMKEFKRKRKDWRYNAIVIRKKDTAKNAKEEKLLKELVPVLKQCQVDFVVIDKWKTLTFLRKEILKQINIIKNRIETEKPSEDGGW